MIETFAPFRALVRREVVVQLRSKWTFLVLAFAVVASGFQVFNVWPSGDAWPRGFMTIPGGATLAAEVGDLVENTALFLALFLVPAAAAASMAREWEQGTRETLLITLLRPRDVVAAKQVHLLSVALLLLLAMTPVSATAFMAVGLDVREFAASLFTAFVCLFYVSAIGLFCGALIKRSFLAILAAYAVVWLTVAAWFWTFVSAVRGSVAQLLSARRSLSPLEWFGQLLDDRPVVFQSIALAVAFLFLIGTALLWARDAPLFPAKRRHRPGSAWAERPIPDGVNPVFSHAMRFGAVTRRTTGTRTVRILIVSSFLVAAALALFDAWRGCGFFYLLSSIIVMLFGGLPAAIAIAKETESGTLESLRMTLLTPRDVVRGNLGAAAVGLAPFLVGVLAGSGVLLYVYGGRPGAIDTILAGIATVCASGWCALCIGLLASAWERGVVTALLAAIGTACVTFFFFPTGWLFAWPLMYWELNRHSALGLSFDDVTAFAALPSPPLAFLGLCEFRAAPRGISSDATMFWACIGTSVAMGYGMLRLALWHVRKSWRADT